MWQVSHYARRAGQEILTRLQRSLQFESKLDGLLQFIYLPKDGVDAVGRRLRILYVAHQSDYGNPRRGVSVEYVSFYLTLLHMGHELIVFDIGRIHREAGHQRANQMLLEAVYRYVPDVVFTVLFRNELAKETIAEIGALPNVTTLNWFTDDHWRFDSYSRHWVPVFDWVATTSKHALGVYHTLGYNNVLYTQWACNHFLHRRLPLPKLYDVSFVGQLHGDRKHVLQHIRRAGINLRVWGFGSMSGRLSTSEMIRIFNQSKINLCLSGASRPGVRQIKARNFEVAGCGAFLLTEHVDDLAEYYELGKEIACYRSFDELIGLIRYYLTHDAERESVAAAGYERTIHDHTYERRLESIFSRIGLR